MTESTDYRALADEALANFLEILDDQDGWSKNQNVNKIFISSKKSTYSDGHMFKAELEIEAPVDKIINYWRPKPKGRRKDWDNTVTSTEGFQIIDDEVMLVRTTTPSAGMGLISPREFIDSVIQRRYPDKNLTVIATQSCEHKDYPIKPDMVRGRNFPCGITFTTIPGTPEKTKLCYLAHTNIGGDIPLALTEAALPSSIHATMNTLRKVATEGIKDDNGNGEGNGM